MLNKTPALILCTFLAAHVLHSADLNLNGQSNKTYENNAYGRLVINNCTSIIIRNCTFAVSSGTVVDIKNSKQIVVENCDIDGKVNACTGINILNNSSQVTIKGCTIHDIADDGIQSHNCSDLFLLNNEISHLYGCGTDGGCGPCYNGHSDGIELFNIDGLEIKGNLIYDVRSTAALFCSRFDTFINKNYVIENNIWYTPESGFVAYVQYTHGLKIYNNIMWKGVYGGIAVGEGITGMEMHNNILHAINYKHMKAAFNANEHTIDYNLLAVGNQGYLPNTHDITDANHAFEKIPKISSSTTYTDVRAEDFKPKSGSKTIDAGFAGAHSPSTDYFGNGRTDNADVANTGDGTQKFYDIGAIEYGGSSTTSARPYRNKAITGRNHTDESLPIAIYSIAGKKLKCATTVRGIYILEGKNSNCMISYLHRRFAR